MLNRKIVITSFVFCCIILLCNEKKIGSNLERIDRDTSYVDGDTLVTVSGFENGKISYKLRLVNGYAMGTSENYDSKGRLIHTKNFFRDNVFGDYIKYFSNGAIKEYRFHINLDTNTFYREYDSVSNKIIAERGTPLVMTEKSKKGKVVSYKLFFPVTIWKVFQVEYSEDGIDYNKFALYRQEKLTAQYGYLDKLIGDETVKEIQIKMSTVDVYGNKRVYQDWVDVSD